MREDVQPPAVRHPDHDLVRAVLGGELDRAVEHGHECVEPLDGELLLAEERAPEVALEALNLGQADEQAALLVGGQRCSVGAGLDRLPKPNARLLVVRDVLDLEGARSRVGLLELGKHVGERLAAEEHAQQRRQDAALQLLGQRRNQPFGLERGVADGLRAGSRRAARCPCVR